MTALSLASLPDDVWTQIIRSHDDRGQWPLISKKFHKLWLAAGVIATSPQNNSLMQKLGADGRIAPEKVDKILRSWAINWLSSHQTVLPASSQINVRQALYYRDTKQMNATYLKIVAAQNQYLIRFAKWLEQHNPSAQSTFQQLDTTQPDAVQAELIRNYFKTTPTLGNIRYEQLQANEFRDLFIDPSNRSASFAVPEEILSLDISRELLTDALTYSVQYKQIPFVTAFVKSPKAIQLSYAVFFRLTNSSALNGSQALVRLFLQNINRGSIGDIDQLRPEVLSFFENIIPILRSYIMDRPLFLLLVQGALRSCPKERLMEAFSMVDNTPGYHRNDIIALITGLSPPRVHSDVAVWHLDAEIPSHDRFQVCLEALLEQPSTNGKRLSEYFVFIMGPFLPYDIYRTALQMIAAHPNAAQMPLAIRILIAVERAWAYITSPIHRIFTFLFDQAKSQLITAFLLLPFTILRLLCSMLLTIITSPRKPQSL